MKGVFITGIGTDVGKTVVSAIIAQALEADYWKPVQTGNLQRRDLDVVRSLVLNEKTKCFTESYSFKLPLAPYTAADAEGVLIKREQFVPPPTENFLVIEGAGGLLVPLAMDYLMVDLIKDLAVPVILVSKFYLGSVNHTLLTVEALRSRNIPIIGLVFNGIENKPSKDVIINNTGLDVIGSLRTETYLDSLVVKGYADSWRSDLQQRFLA